LADNFNIAYCENNGKVKMFSFLNTNIQYTAHTDFFYEYVYSMYTLYRAYVLKNVVLQ